MVGEFLVWFVTLTTLAQWQPARELGQPITGSRWRLKSFCFALLPAACFVCLFVRKISGTAGWSQTPDVSSLLAHEDSRSRWAESERCSVESGAAGWESLTRQYFLPGDRGRSSGASFFPPFTVSLVPSTAAAAHRPWPWWLCSDLPPPVRHPRPAAARGRWVEKSGIGVSVKRLLRAFLQEPI